MGHQNTRWEKSYPSAEMQSLYSAAPADRVGFKQVNTLLFQTYLLDVYIESKDVLGFSKVI